jgi:hypothetical protein
LNRYRAVVSFELRCRRQLLPGRRRRNPAICHSLAVRVEIRTVILCELGIHQREPRGNREAVGRRPLDLAFHTLDARVTGIRDLRHAIAVGGQKTELEVLPGFPKKCAIEAQAAVKPGPTSSSVAPSGRSSAYAACMHASSTDATGNPLRTEDARLSS